MHCLLIAVCLRFCTWVPATADEEVARALEDVPDIGVGCGVLPPDDLDGEVGEGTEGVDEAEAETDVMSQRSKPDPESEPTKLVKPQPVAALLLHPLEERYAPQELRPCGRLIV